MSDRIEVMGLNSQWDFVTLQGDDSIEYDRKESLGTATPYAPVKITGDKTVGLAEDGDEIYGTLCSVEHDGACRIGKGNVQEFRNPDETSIAFGVPVVAGEDNTVVAGTAGSGVGSVVGTGTINGLPVIYVDLK